MRLSLRHMLAIMSGLMLLAAVVGVLIWQFKPDVVADASADRAGEAEAIEAAKAAVATRAPDATALNFGTVKINWVGSDPAVCGYVDIVETQDSFEGQERFIWVDGEVTLEESDGSDAVQRQWQAVCQSV